MKAAAKIVVGAKYHTIQFTYGMDIAEDRRNETVNYEIHDNT
jgi:hypothetical protein